MGSSCEDMVGGLEIGVVYINSHISWYRCWIGRFPVSDGLTYKQNGTRALF